MKKNTILKILIVVIATLTLSIILSILGGISRLGYLTDINIDVDKTLSINQLDNIKLSITNYNDLISFIETNKNITNYIYNFKIRYYSKIFRNSDIYNVYLNTNSLPDYINHTEFYKNGSPFGIIKNNHMISNDKIDIYYSLKVKVPIYFYILLFFIISVILFSFRKQILIFINYIANIIKMMIIRYNKYRLYLIVFIIIFLFISSFNPQSLSFNVVVISDNVSISSVDSISWKTKYGFNDIQKLSFSNNIVQTLKFTNIHELKVKSTNDFSLDNYRRKEYYVIKNNNIDLHFYDQETMITNYNLHSNETMIISHNSNELNIYVSSAIYTPGFHQYIKGWKIESTNYNIKYSLFLYTDEYYQPKELSPYIVSGEGYGDTIFNNFNNLFFRTIKDGHFPIHKLVIMLIVSFVYLLLFIFISKIIFNKEYRNKILSNEYILFYIFYLFLYWILFLAIGSYEVASTRHIPRLINSQNIYIAGEGFFNDNFWPIFTHYLAGPYGFNLLFFISYSGISLIIYYLLKKLNFDKTISILIPIILLLLPNINVVFYTSWWRAFNTGIFYTLSLLLVFLMFYGDQKYAKMYSILSIISSLISISYRHDIIPLLFINIAAILFFYLKKINIRNILIIIFISSIVSILVFFMFEKTYLSSSSRMARIYAQCLLTYALPEFYKEDTFTDEEKKILKFNEPYPVNTNISVLEGIRKDFKYEDYHTIGFNYMFSVGVPLEEYKRILIAKMKKNPYPAIYSRIRTFITLTIRNSFPINTQEDIQYSRKDISISDILDYNFDIVKRSKFHKDFIDKFVSYENEFIGGKTIYFYGTVNFLIMLFIFIRFKKNPVTAYLNLTGLMYHGILFILNFAEGIYYYGPYLFSVISILLCFYEGKKYIKN